jgi:hypothetical protein
VQVVIKKRGADGLFREIWSAGSSRQGASSPRAGDARGEVIDVAAPLARRDKVDLLLLGDGYTAAERDASSSTRARPPRRLFATEPFKSRPADFNVRALFVPAAQTGISNRARTCGATRRSAPASTPSTATATCSRSTTARCATPRRRRRTTR